MALTAEARVAALHWTDIARELLRLSIVLPRG
jgi:hypothetical protein